MRSALTMFTAIPVPGSWHGVPVSPRVIAWLPPLGGVLGAVAGLPAALVLWRAPGAGLLGAVLAVVVLALLTRGLHLDGLADTADGLGSRAPAERALEIMRRSDIGPFGVVTLVLVLAVDLAAVTALAADGRWTPSPLWSRRRPPDVWPSSTPVCRASPRPGRTASACSSRAGRPRRPLPP